MVERQQGVIEKNWGYELIWASNDRYCGKILVFEKAGNSCPMHFHKDKDKSWFVNNGKFIVRWIDTSTATLYQQELLEGETWHVQPLHPHQLEALSNGASIAEVSSADSIEDIFNIIPETNQAQN